MPTLVLESEAVRTEEHLTPVNRDVRLGKGVGGLLDVLFEDVEDGGEDEMNMRIRSTTALLR